MCCHLTHLDDVMSCLSFSPCYITYISFFFFNDTATTEIYTLSLHDALPISREGALVLNNLFLTTACATVFVGTLDRKSTRLNSSHVAISYAVFCLKKKKLH